MVEKYIRIEKCLLFGVTRFATWPSKSKKVNFVYSLTFSIRMVRNVDISDHDHSMDRRVLPFVSGENDAQMNEII